MNILLSFLISLAILYMACDQLSDYSVAPPAGKATISDECLDAPEGCLAVQWECADGDSTFTVFHGDVRLLVWPDSVEVTQYLTNNTKRVYIASETSTRFSRFRADRFRLDGVCGVWSDAINVDDYTRIFIGDVSWSYRGTDDSRLQVSEGDELYHIANINEDGGASYVDFWSVFSRNTKPPSLEGRYYIPLNFDTEVIMDFDRLPNDDRHYLDSPLVVWEGCQIDAETPVSPRVRSGGGIRGISGGGATATTQNGDSGSGPKDETVTCDPTKEIVVGGECVPCYNRPCYYIRDGDCIKVTNCDDGVTPCLPHEHVEGGFPIDISPSCTASSNHRHGKDDKDEKPRRYIHCHDVSGDDCIVDTGEPRIVWGNAPPNPSDPGSYEKPYTDGDDTCTDEDDNCADGDGTGTHWHKAEYFVGTHKHN